MSKPTLYILTHYSTPWLLCIVQYSTVQYPKRVQQLANVMKKFGLYSKYLVNSCLMRERRFEYWIYITCSKFRSYHCRQCSVQMSNKEVLSFIKSILQSESKLQYTKYKFFKNKDERGIFGAMHWLFRTIKLSPAPPSLLTSSRDICVKIEFFFFLAERGKMLTRKNLPFCKFLLANNCFPVDTIPWREYSPGGPILQLFITILNIKYYNIIIIF